VLVTVTNGVGTIRSNTLFIMDEIQQDEENTLFIHKYVPIEDLSKLNNILWALEIEVKSRIPMILLAG